MSSRLTPEREGPPHDASAPPTETPTHDVTVRPPSRQIDASGVAKRIVPPPTGAINAQSSPRVRRRRLRMGVYDFLEMWIGEVRGMERWTGMSQWPKPAPEVVGLRT